MRITEIINQIQEKLRNQVYIMVRTDGDKIYFQACGHPLLSEMEWVGEETENVIDSIVNLYHSMFSNETEAQT